MYMYIMIVTYMLPERVSGAVTCWQVEVHPRVAQKVETVCPVQTQSSGLQTLSHQTQTGHSDRDRTCAYIVHVQ